jgi:hypothetical protein
MRQGEPSHLSHCSIFIEASDKIYYISITIILEVLLTLKGRDNMAKNRKCIKSILALLVILLVVLIILRKMDMYKNPQSVKDLLTTEDETIISDNADEPDAMSVFMCSSLSEKNIDRIVGVSWQENTPVKLEELSYVNVTYWGFDDTEHIGEMIVHEKLAQEVIDIFKELYEAKFPIEKIKLIDEYDADDNLSMADNNSYAFCSREVTGKKGKFSNHSYGIAIDINPVQNPYVKGDIVLPEEGNNYLNREDIRKGMIIKGDMCYNAFKSRGWTWGGEWKSLKDYQHFEKEIDFK